ncbi:MAG TPA: transglutaminase N-terminal domain-containing protein, partial [Pseudomonadales bacterium]
MDYRIRHSTHYQYAHPVGSSYLSLHLTPREFARQSVTQASISVSPRAQSQTSRADFFGNQVTDLF